MMNKSKRLTMRDEYGNAELIALPGMVGMLFPELSMYELDCLAHAIDKLSDYEDAESVELPNMNEMKIPPECIKEITRVIITVLDSLQQFMKTINDRIDSINKDYIYLSDLDRIFKGEYGIEDAEENK